MSDFRRRPASHFYRTTMVRGSGAWDGRICPHAVRGHGHLQKVRTSTDRPLQALHGSRLLLAARRARLHRAQQAKAGSARAGSPLEARAAESTWRAGSSPSREASSAEAVSQTGDAFSETV